MFILKSPTLFRFWDKWFVVIISTTMLLVGAIFINALDIMAKKAMVERQIEYALIDNVYYTYPITCLFGVTYRYREVQVGINNYPIACEYISGTTLEIQALDEIR